MKKHGINYPVASAKDLPSPYEEIQSIPTTFFIDRNGVIQSIAVGYHDFKAIRPQGKYCAQMTARIVDADGTIQAVAIGGDRAIAFDQNGQVAWSTPSIKQPGAWRKTTFAGGALTGDGQSDWVFHEATGNLLVVSWRGEKRALLPKQERLEDFTIVPTQKAKALLVTLSDSTLRAWEFAPTTKTR